jgi:FtsP/CotA-like multicopper oxidase with cupredoxin domain
MLRTYDCAQVPERTPCQADVKIATFDFQPNKTHLLRLINTSGEGTQVFSIDNHILIVISNDFVPVEPYEADYVILGPGQRSDVVVTGTGHENTSYYARTNVGPCDPISHPNAVAAVNYPGADKTKLPSSESVLSMNASFCQNVRSECTHSRYSYLLTL